MADETPPPMPLAAVYWMSMTKGKAMTGLHESGSASRPTTVKGKEQCGGAGDRHRNEYVMMPAIIALSPAGFCRPQWRTALVPSPHAIWRPVDQSAPSTPRGGPVSPRPLAPVPVSRTSATPWKGDGEEHNPPRTFYDHHAAAALRAGMIVLLRERVVSSQIA